MWPPEPVQGKDPPDTSISASSRTSFPGLLPGCDHCQGLALAGWGWGAVAPPCLPVRPMDCHLGGLALWFLKGPRAGAREGAAGRGPGLTLVDGVLRQLAELAAGHARVGAQELLLAGRQLQGRESCMSGGRAAPEGGCPGLRDAGDVSPPSLRSQAVYPQDQRGTPAPETWFPGWATQSRLGSSAARPAGRRRPCSSQCCWCRPAQSPGGALPGESSWRWGRGGKEGQPFELSLSCPNLVGHGEGVCLWGGGRWGMGRKTAPAVPLELDILGPVPHELATEPNYRLSMPPPRPRRPQAVATAFALPAAGAPRGAVARHPPHSTHVRSHLSQHEQHPDLLLNVHVLRTLPGGPLAVHALASSGHSCRRRCAGRGQVSG